MQTVNASENAITFANKVNGNFAELQGGGGGSSSTPCLSVKSYGAIGDGVTDDTDALETAFAAAYTAGLPIMFPQGTYLIRRPLTLRDDMEIFGVGNATIKKRAATTTRLAVAAAEGDTTITVVSASGFEVGDCITISKRADTYPAARYDTVGKITAISGNNITFVSLLSREGAGQVHPVDSYVTNSHALLRSWGMHYTARNVSIHDLTLDGNRQSGEFGDWQNGCIHIDACDGQTRNGNTYNKEAKNLVCRDLIIKNSPFDGISDQSAGGGVFERIKIDNSYMHGIHFGTIYSGAVVHGCTIENTENGAGIFWCQEVTDIVVEGNIIRNCNKGCSDQEYGSSGGKSIISGNIFDGCKSLVVDFSFSGTSGSLIISGNMITNLKSAVCKIPGEANISIVNNVIANITTAPSYLFSLANSTNVTLIGNIAPSDAPTIIDSNGQPTSIINVNNTWNN